MLTLLASAFVSAWWLMALVVIVATAIIYGVVRRREQRRARTALERAVRMELHIPSSLHPVIDPDVCIGSGSCLSACPEGPIIGLVNGVAQLVEASHCIGHGRCAAECPVGAIKLVFGSAERGVELPQLSAEFETARPGVFIVGELAGMGLIKNALLQGLQVASFISADLAGERGDQGRAATPGEQIDIAIVGAGPAGISAAVAARAAGLSFALIEQDTVGGTVAHYPRQKLVMTESIDLPYYGRFGKPHMSKEELIAAFQELMARARIGVHQHTKVTGIDGARGAFTVHTSRGAVQARRVVLAVGRRGTPRPLGVAGEDSDRVAYRLIDPRQYDGKRVLVVGGGDSALEAATMLARESSASVTVSYRRPEFGRCRPLNRQNIADLLARGKVRALMATEVTALRSGRVVLKDGTGKVHTLENDFVIACLGGELPTEFLKSVGVAIRRHDGRVAMPNPALSGRPAASSNSRRSAVVLTLLGLGVLAALAAVGWDYYTLPRALRYLSPQHDRLKPSGAWGHGVGILASLVMLSNFAYSMRKRLRPFKGKSSIQPWLRFHVFVGLMSPVTILFHSALQWGNHLATITYLSLLVLVVTGLLGRYVYGFVRMDARATDEAAELRAKLRRVLERLPRVVAADGAGRATPASVGRLWALAQDPEGTAPASLTGTAPPSANPWRVMGLLLRLPVDGWTMHWQLRRLRPLFLIGAEYRRWRHECWRLRRLDIKLRCHLAFKRLMGAWRIFHVTLAVVLVGLVGLHVWISLRIGFRWIWS